MCGAYFNVVPGQQFFCYDPLTTIYHHCVGTNDWRYICWDAAGQEWEWGNYNEADGTPDNSLLTSIETDGLIGTSVSVKVQDNYFEEGDYSHDHEYYSVEAYSPATDYQEEADQGINFQNN